MKHSAAALLFMALCLSVHAADTLSVNSFRYVGPFEILTPFAVDSINVDGKQFSSKDALERPVSASLLSSAPSMEILQPMADSDALHLLGFSVQCEGWTKAELQISGIESYVTLLDGKKLSGTSLKLEPGTHEVVVKCLTLAGATPVTPDISLVVTGEGSLQFRDDGRRIYSLDLNTQGASCGGISVSPSGKYYTVIRRMAQDDGKSTSVTEVVEAESRRVIYRSADRISWLPKQDCWYLTERTEHGRNLVSVDPATGEKSLIASDIPEGSFRISPDGEYLLYTLENKGPKEGDVHQILVPDDRQPGWRNRNYLARYDIATGFMQPLTYGYHNSWLSDISDDGASILFMTSFDDLSKRPTTHYTIYKMDVRTLETTCIVEDDGFINSASFSPDGNKVLVVGSPEAFDGVGKDVLEGQTPNTFDVQLFVIDIPSGKVKPLTKKFNPSIVRASWSRFDGKIYLIAEDRDCKNLFRINPDNAKSERLPNQEDYLYQFSLAETSPLLIYYGQSLCNGDRVYTMNTKNSKQEMVRDFHEERFSDVDLGEGGEYEFTSSRGDKINGFYVLPPDFDPSRKYPMLVHYYGGCSPSSRYCVGSYSPQYYAAQGYVFYVINPSGAAGFGQEFAARHVNTAGDVVADDIIEGTRHFCADHPFVDSTRVGCFSASYGGFMTQLLLSKTDIYATGISHAGISSHTSYWGEGYWGYSYSETSMADSYPWTRKDLYVDRSPIYFADKIHTPILFLHGSADTNVPIGESIQMFTAMKLLGVDTAFVVVDGENHGIADYTKKRQWLRTISAWFAKYLKDEPGWWDELYPQKNL